MIAVFGKPDLHALEQLERCAAVEPDARAVLCADNHVGYSQPIGGAVAYRDHVSPSGVGYDIGCGNKAVLTELSYDDVRDDVARIMDEVCERVSFGVGRESVTPVEHPVLDRIREAAFEPQRELLDLAASQLGTVGAGNHYVDLFRDERERVWVGVHFGSRGFGHRTAGGFLALAQGHGFGARAREGGMDAPPVVFSASSSLGEAYVEAMTLAGEYAYAGRDVVVDTVLDILGTRAVEEVHNHHNFAWREEHGGEEWWVVRKGCTPAFPGQRGFVGATMGGVSVILEGVESSRSEEALHSTVHGAGRTMSRTKAAGKLRTHRVGGVRRRVREGGAIDFRAVQAELASRGIELRGGAADEAPGAYKDLREVIAAHAGTVRVLHELRPIGVAMAPADTFDPYKD